MTRRPLPSEDDHLLFFEGVLGAAAVAVAVYAAVVWMLS